MPLGLNPVPRRAHGPALALSLLLHAAAFAAVAWLVLPSGAPAPLINIVLTGGGGGGGGDPPPAAENAAPAPQPPPPAAEPVAPRPEPKQPPIKRRVVAPKPARPKSPVEPVVEPRAETAKVEASDRGAGDGSGTGSGSGTGRGSGEGNGSGSGVGSGRGAGANGDLRVLCLSCPEPPYPRIARLRGWEGVVDVEISIAADGTVAAASVAQSSGHSALDEAALASARRSRFQVLADAGGVRGRIPYRFRLTTRGSAGW